MDEEQVLCAARLLKLNLSKEQLPGVTAQLQRIEQIAQALEAVELDPFTDEMAPTWRP
jgi:Asp-tRNA(Asn)/Glu-tRNA(Gln) amidotransferase C subunit